MNHINDKKKEEKRVLGKVTRTMLVELLANHRQKILDENPMEEVGSHENSFRATIK